MSSCMSSTLIKNAQVIDGSGGPAFKADIFIRNNMIVEVGDLKRQSADKVIQATGLVVTPGFIDVATSSDHYLTLFSNPDQQDFLLQGVTTTLAGMCGSSLAPLLYGGLESVRKWGNVLAVNVDWHTTKEFFDVLARQKIGVNFGTLVGHSTVRRALIGETLRDLTEGELQVFQEILLGSLADGARGLSTGLGYAHSVGTPYYEIKRLVTILKNKNGVYATHLRSDGFGLLDSVKELISIAKETGVTSCITHMHPRMGFETDYMEALKLIEKNASEADVYFTIFPFETSHVPIYSLLPTWAKNGGLEVMLTHLENDAERRELLRDMAPLHTKEISIAYVQNHEYLGGKSLHEFAEARNVEPLEGLLMLMKISRLRAVLSYRNLDYPLVVRALAHPRSLIGSSASSYPPGEGIGERGATFPAFLEIALSEKLMSLEAAIQKITSVPAKKYHILRRGLIKNGYFADLTLFSTDTSNKIKIKQVLVSGELVVLEGELLNGTSGMVLR